MSAPSATAAGHTSITRPPGLVKTTSAIRSKPSIVENVAEGPDTERVMTQMALDGADLIFTTSFGYMDPTINVGQDSRM